MQRIVIKSRVGSNGILELMVPVGSADADREVQVTVEPIGPPKLTQEEWARRVLENAGTWQGDFERPEQGEYEVRDPMSSICSTPTLGSTT